MALLARVTAILRILTSIFIRNLTFLMMLDLPLYTTLLVKIIK